MRSRTNAPLSLTFTKLFSSITESTVWCEPAHTRLVWITMLAMADRQGRVWASIPGLANRARVPLEDTEKALNTLLGPDKYSRTPDNDGRRIEPIDGGWRLLNHAKYRDLRDEEVRREQNREAKERQRDKSATVLTVMAGQPQSAQAEADTEAESVTSKAGDSLALVQPNPLDEILPSNIPYKEIVALFNEHMTILPRVRELTNRRRSLIRSAWTASKKRQSMKFWKAYFEECSDDAFLNGAGPYGKGHENWLPSFDYLLKNDVVTRTYEKAMQRVGA